MKKLKSQLTLTACLLLPFAGHAQQVISDTLNGVSAVNSWKSFNGACLTAGNNTGSIPACVGLPYYSGKTLVGGASGKLPDAVGQGALRLTNGDTILNGSNGTNQTGAIVSTVPFPSSQGVQVTFSTVTYGGNGANTTGADGMTFFLADALQAPSVGALGGSLGYSCSNVNSTYDGVRGGYVGVGIDEYGNFTNGATTTTGSNSVTVISNGDNTSSGSGASPSTIGVRGAGNVNWYYLNSNYPTLYPTSADQKNAVQQTCRTGTLYNASNSTQTVTVNGSSTSIKSGTSSTLPVLNYKLLGSSALLTSGNNAVTISNQQGTLSPTRGQAKPITYALSITQNGLLNMSYSFDGGVTTPVITDQSITASNGAVPANFLFGFSGGTGGGSNVHEITCFKAAQINAASTSAGVNVQQSSRVEAGTQVYLSYYHPTNWWGQLTATSLIYTAATDSVAFNTSANWDASCVLTGGACSTTGASNTAQTPVSRSLLTWNGSAGIPFQWANLTSSQQSNLGDTGRLAYLRGDRSGEITTTNTSGLRTRTGVLGDITNSGPVWVGAPALPYKGPWKDAINSLALTPEGTSYTSYASSNATRTNVVYSGANDGLMHGFRAGAYKTDGTFDAGAVNDGQELIGYMPAAISAVIRNATASLDFTSPQYVHSAFVDATAGTGDLYYAGAWHTWLVSGTGAGGNAGGPINDNTTTATGGSIFALDVTSPANFSEAKAASLVIGDWGPSSLTCVTGTTSNCGANLGNTYGTPLIRRLHDGNWAVIFGNGYNSSTGTAGIFIMTVKQSDGSKTFRFLDTAYGPSKDPLGKSSKNGMAFVASADLDGDHITDYIYAGDLFGNLWRFDLTASTAILWSAGTSPVFSTPAGQPITTNVTVSSALSKTGPPRVMIDFGTGQKLPQIQTSAATYASAAGQSLYGIWDWNMSVWNAKSATQYASLIAPQTVNTTVLQVQTATNVAGSSGAISGFRTVTSNPVCWAGLSNCASGKNVMFGWQLAFPSSNEQLIYSPTTNSGLFVVNTVVPAVSNALTCSNQPASGYTMAVAIDTGGATATSFFADATNNYVSTNGLVISGIGLSATGTPSFVTALKKPYLITQTVSGIGSITQVNPAANGIGKRISWIKLR